MTADLPDADDLLEQAIDWMLRLDAAPDDAALQRDLDRWREQHPGHAEAWRRATRAWGAAAQLEPDRRQWPLVDDLPGPVSAQLTPRRRRRAVVSMPFVSLAMAACLLLVAWPSLRIHFLADYMTGSGELRLITLADGSTVHLSASSAIRTDFEGDTRRVELLAGQAYFDVVRNPQRPFLVSADGMDVTVLGTSFDVQTGAGLYAVSVKTGVVAVRYQGGVAQQLQPGQQLLVERSNGLVNIDAIAVDNVAAWREGRLFVHNRRVADVLETLDRYYPGHILLASAEMSSKRITGSYDLASPDAALRAVVGPLQGQVLSFTPLLRVLGPVNTN